MVVKILVNIDENELSTTNFDEIYLNDYVKVFDDIKKCDEYIEQISINDRIYIVSNVVAYTSVKARVYIYENNQVLNNIIESITTDHANNQINSLGINIFKQLTHSQLNSEFLWFQRVLSILIGSHDRERAKTNFLDIYKRYFEGNRNKEENIRRFETTYQSEYALQWYTKECFFYEVLNKALRTQDIDVLFSFRFFLKDMNNQLKFEYDQVSHNIDFVVYRGQILSSNELQSIRDSIGQFISLNSFISTTRDEQLARAFCLSGDPNGEHVIFQIKINKTLTNSKPFADITKRSHFTHEQEVLFMAGSIFEIKQVRFSDMWIIDLDLCDDNVYELYDVHRIDRTLVSEQHSPFSLAAVLCRMNLFDKAKVYYQQLLDEGSIIEMSDVDLRVNCYWGLGHVFQKEGEYDIALAYERLAIEQSQDRLDLLFQSYKYMSQMYFEIHSTVDALEYQYKALTIQKEIHDKQDQIADTLYNIGLIYFHQLRPDTDRALEYLMQALEIFKELHLYLDVTRCYDSIGMIYLKKKQKDLALNYHFLSLQLIDEHYSSYLPHRIVAYEYIARAYESMHDYEQAVKYYNDALEMKFKFEPPNDPNIADSYEMLGGIYHRKKEYTIAIEMYDKAIEIRKHIQLDFHPALESVISTRNALQNFIEFDKKFEFFFVVKKIIL